MGSSSNISSVLLSWGIEVGVRDLGRVNAQCLEYSLRPFSLWDCFFQWLISSNSVFWFFRLGRLDISTAVLATLSRHPTLTCFRLKAFFPKITPLAFPFFQVSNLLKNLPVAVHSPVSFKNISVSSYLQESQVW